MSSPRDDSSVPSKAGGSIHVPRFCVILPAAGKSSRFCPQMSPLDVLDTDFLRKKQFANLIDGAVWNHSVRRFLARRDVVQMIIVIADEDRAIFESKFASNIVIDGLEIAPGGDQRADSIKNAIALVRPDVDYVCVHDAARPCITDEMIEGVFVRAIQTGAAMLACPVSDTLKRVDQKGFVSETIDRTGLWMAQTPQVFRRDWFIEAYQQQNTSSATDDSVLMERLGHKVSVVQGSRMNIKITTQDDLKVATQLLKAAKRKSAVSFF